MDASIRFHLWQHCARLLKVVCIHTWVCRLPGCKWYSYNVLESCSQQYTSLALTVRDFACVHVHWIHAYHFAYMYSYIATCHIGLSQDTSTLELCFQQTTCQQAALSIQHTLLPSDSLKLDTLASAACVLPGAPGTPSLQAGRRSITCACSRGSGRNLCLSPAYA